MGLFGSSCKPLHWTPWRDNVLYFPEVTKVPLMLYSYSHRYQDKKDKMIVNMTQIAKQLGDLNIKRLIAHCVIFPTILKEFNEILSNELEQRRNKR
jgi:hypothetical protein